jgi:hypothetical protein
MNRHSLWMTIELLGLASSLLLSLLGLKIFVGIFYTCSLTYSISEATCVYISPRPELASSQRINDLTRARGSKHDYGFKYVASGGGLKGTFAPTRLTLHFTPETIAISHLIFLVEADTPRFIQNIFIRGSEARCLTIMEISPRWLHERIHVVLDVYHIWVRSRPAMIMMRTY